MAVVREVSRKLGNSMTKNQYFAASRERRARQNVKHFVAPDFNLKKKKKTTSKLDKKVVKKVESKVPKGKAAKTTKGAKGAVTINKVIAKGTKAAKAAKTAKVVKKGNERLVPRDGIAQYKENPFLFGKSKPDFVSISTYPRWLIRAVAKKDAKEIETVLKDERLNANESDVVFSKMDQRYAATELMRIGDEKLIQTYYKLLAKNREIKNRKFAKEPNLLQKKTTGRSNFYMIGRHTRTVEMTRGGREGNNAFLNYEGSNPDESDILHVLCEDGVSFKELTRLSKIKVDGDINPLQNLGGLSMCLSHAARMGHRELAAAIATGPANYSCNELHRQTLNNQSKLPDRILPISVIKKAFDNRAITPLHTAAINPNPKLLERLRTVEPNINIPDQDNWMTLHYASVCDGTANMEYLLKNGASPIVVTKKGESPLHVAARAGRVKNVEILLKAIRKLEDPEKPNECEKPEKSFVNARTRAGETVLHLAVKYNRPEVVKALLDNPLILADIPTSTGTNKMTPLMIACGQGLLPIVELLVAKNALVEGKDKKKKTPLMYAIINGQQHVAAFLLAKGADIHKKDSSGNTAAHYAAAYGWLDCLRLLAEVDAKCLEAENDWKITPLSIAYLKGHYGIVTWLLDGDYKDQVNINGKDMEGTTLLASLLKYTDKDTIGNLVTQLQYLVDRGADCSLSDGQDNSALHVFAELAFPAGAISDKDYKKCLELILKNGGDKVVEAKNQFGKTPLHLALSSKNLSLFYLLVPKVKDPAAFFTSEWNTEFNLMHEVLLHPVNVWKASEMWAEVSKPPKDLYDVIPFIRDSLKKHCSSHLSTWLCSLNKAGVQPVNQMIMEYMTLMMPQRSNSVQVKEFVDYISELLRYVVAIEPTVLKMTFKKQNDEIVYSPLMLSLTLNLEVDACSHTLLQTILDESKKQRMLHDVLLIGSDVDQSLIIKAIDINVAGAAKILAVTATDSKYSDGVHNAVQRYEGAGENKKEVNKTLLMYMIEKKQFEMVSMLKLTTSDWQAADFEGNNVWHYAAQSSHHKTVALLKEVENKGVAVIPNGYRIYPLHSAVIHCDGSANAVLDPIEWLTVKMDVTALDIFGRTALHYAFASPQAFDDNTLESTTRDPISVVSILVNRMDKDSINQADCNGYTALHLAAICNANICAVTLLRKGAKVDVKDKDGNTPLALAALYGRQSVALTLIQANGSVTDKVSFPETKKEKENLWVWKGSKKETAKKEASSVAEQVVAKGSSWEAMVYVLLDVLGKSTATLAQIVNSALLKRQYNLANQLLKSLETNLQGKKLETNYDLLLTFASTFYGQPLTVDCVEQAVLDRLFAIGCSLNPTKQAVKEKKLNPQSSPAIEKAIENGQWQLLEVFTSKFNLKNIEASEAYGGPLKSLALQLNKHISVKGERLLVDVKHLKNIDIDEPLSLPMPPELSELSLGPLPMMSWAAAIGNHHLIRLLRRVGADINVRDSEGRTPLMIAILANKAESVEAICGDGIAVAVKISVKATTKAKVNGVGSLFLGNSFTGVSRKRKAGDDDEEGSEATDEDNEDHSETESEESDQEVEQEEQSTGNTREETPLLKKVRLDNKKLDISVKSDDFSNIFHFLALPMQWENVDLFNALFKLNLSTSIKLLKDKNKDGLTPLELAKSLKQRRLAEAMLKATSKNGEKLSLASDLPDVSKLKCIHDVVADSNAFLEKWAKEKDEKKTATKPKPSNQSGYADTGEIVTCPDTAQYMAVLLNKTDVNYGRYGFHNFYRMQLIKRRDTDLWILFTNWGRIGMGTGEYQTTPFNSFDAGAKEFKSVFKSKSGNEWRPLDQFEDLPKKYKLVKIDSTPTTLREIELSDIGKNTETDAVRRFIRDISDPKELKQYSNAIRQRLSLDCPFGRVSAEAIAKARELLDECMECVERLQKILEKTHSDEEVLELFQQTRDLSSEFYSVIPIGDCEFSSLTTFDSKESIEQARGTLNRMEEVTVAMQLLTAAEQRKAVLDRVDYIKSALECEIKALSPNDEMSQKILQCIETTGGSVTVQGIFEIAPSAPVKNFEKFGSDANQKFLWHGTRATNLLSIIKKGFLVDSPAARTGRAFGEGVYFSDAFAKSLNYCHAGADGVKYMLLNQVATGKQLEFSHEHLNAKCDTYFVRGTQCPLNKVTYDGVQLPLGPLGKTKGRIGYWYLEYSEFIVGNTDRVLPRYVVAFK